MVWSLLSRKRTTNTIRKKALNQCVKAMPKEWSAIQTGIIITGIENINQLNQLSHLMADMEKEHKKMTALIYVKDLKKANLSTPLPEGVFLCQKKDFRARSVPQSAELNQLLSQSYDWLLDMNFDEDISLFSLSNFSNACFKTGVDTALNMHLQLSIDLSTQSSSQDLYEAGLVMIDQIKKIHLA
ncbi:MAG: hypothetical protein LC101_03300 [Flavobacteriales bacterium]|nr:hypothetical protein [Flavobacteriales bacterium]MCZ2442786.1 hypothetical protein [Flavobacteriales bacterium]